MLFEIDIFAWIPHPEVPNPIAGIPGGVKAWGPAACGPNFGGDDFEKPDATPSHMHGRTFRAHQNLSFRADPWGSIQAEKYAGVVPGMTTVLTGTRKAGGRKCHEMRAKVLESNRSLKFSASDDWYEIGLQAKVMDPVPAAVGARTGKTVGQVVGWKVPFVGSEGGGELGRRAGESLATALTPALAWELNLRIQRGAKLGRFTEAGYFASAPFGFDESSTLVFSRSSLGPGTDNLVHGLMDVRRYPSYVVYLSLTPPGGATSVQPIFYANAMPRDLAEIVIEQDSEIRRVTW